MKKNTTFIKCIFLTIFFSVSLLKSQNSWILKSSTPTAAVLRAGAFSFTVNGKGYIGGGGTAIAVPVPDFWEYDPITDSWSQMANLPNGGMVSSVGFAIGNKGYYGTGESSSSTLGTKGFWEYNPSTNIWTTKANFGGLTRRGAAGFSIGNKGYIGLGNGTIMHTDFWEYNPATDVWTQKTSFPAAGRVYAVGFNINNKGYIGTGDSGISPENDFWEYDPLIDAWTQKANFGGGLRRYATGFAIGNYGYIGTGNDGTNDKNDFWEYNSSTDTWSQKTNFAGTIRGLAYGFSIGNKGYIGGGSNGPAYQADFWEYTPCSLTSSIVSQTNLVCNNVNNGTATVSAFNGSGIYTYSWSPSGGSSSVATNLGANTYTCFISDNNSCSTTQTVTITQPSAITSSISSQTNLLCNGANSGSATITANGGTGAFTYSWIPTGGTNSSITNQFAGTYTCIIKDANLCAKNQTITITEPTVITTTISAQTNVSCNGGNNSAVFVSANGGTGTFTYSWIPSGGNAALASGLPAGSYTCNVKDANNCLKSQTVTVTQPNPIATSISSQTNVSCYSGVNGAATISVTASGSITYTWTPTGGNNSTAIGLTAGNYNCTITDANGCNKTQTVAITQPNAITTSVASQTNVTCNGGTNGSATILVNGGTSSYTYSWSPTGGNLSTSNNLSNGTYTFLVLDANNCSKSQTINITQPNAITTSVPSQTNVTCYGGTNGSATVLVNGGTSSYTYSWSPTGGNLSTANNLSNGTYTCLVLDANNCSKSQTITITQPNAIDITTNLNISTISSNQFGAGYQWINCNTGNSAISGAINQSFTPIVNGSYAVTITYNTCISTSTCVSITDVGIQEYLSNSIQALNIYPNPNNGNFDIKSNSEGDYKIINELGQTIKIFQLNSNNSFTANIDELPQGIYYVVGKENNKTLCQKIVIIK